MSKGFTFSKENLDATLKVFGWTVASAVVVLFIDLLGVIEVPVQYAFIVPVVNTMLYAIKEYISSQR